MRLRIWWNTQNWILFCMFNASERSRERERARERKKRQRGGDQTCLCGHKHPSFESARNEYDTFGSSKCRHWKFCSASISPCPLDPFSVLTFRGKRPLSACDDDPITQRSIYLKMNRFRCDCAAFCPPRLQQLVGDFGKYQNGDCFWHPTQMSCHPTLSLTPPGQQCTLHTPIRDT
jgi:hypothetical protein